MIETENVMFSFTRSSALRRAILGVFSGLLLVSAAASADVRIIFANDFLASNKLDDDLYTGAFIIDYPLGRFVLTGGENLFTDSENGLRFDETFLKVGRDLRPRGAWSPRFEVGAIHVGRGLLGEDVQNAIHRLIGDDEVFLDYVEGSRVYPTIRLLAERPLPLLRDFDLRFEADVAAAVGFKEHAIARLRAQMPISGSLRVDLAVGARYSRTSFDALKPRLETLGPTWEAGLTFRDRVAFGWDYNSFGTKSQHFNIVYIGKLGRKSRTRDPVRAVFERQAAALERRLEAIRDAASLKPDLLSGGGADAD